MKAIILAGGMGARLKPYTTVIPKPLVPVGETAVIEILLKRLKKFRVDEVYICLNHFAEIIRAFLGDGNKFGLKIHYSLEEKPLGTVAPIRLLENLPEDFLVMNGDLLTDLDFADLFSYHLENKSLLTVAVYQRKSTIDFGVIETDPERNKVTGFTEKPEYKFEVSMGVYVMNQKILSMVPYNRRFGFDDLMISLLKKKKDINVYRFKGYWLDIGRPDDYDKANADIEWLKKSL